MSTPITSVNFCLLFRSIPRGPIVVLNYTRKRDHGFQENSRAGRGQFSPEEGKPVVAREFFSALRKSIYICGTAEKGRHILVLGISTRMYCQ